MAPLLQGNYREFGKVLACSCVNTFLCHICLRIDGLSRGLFHLQKPPPPFRRQGNSPEKRASQDKVFRSISAPRAAFGGCAPKRFAAARSAMSGQRLCLWKPQFFEKNCVKLLIGDRFFGGLQNQKFRPPFQRWRGRGAEPPPPRARGGTLF